MISLLLTVALVSLEGDTDWEGLRQRLQVGGVERERALRYVANEMPAGETAELLESLVRWPPGPSLALRQVLVEGDRFRYELLAAALNGDLFAAELLLEQRVARIDQSGPWSQGVAALRDRVDLLSPPGLRLQFWTAPGQRFSLGELVQVLDETGSFSRPVIVHPACALETVALIGDARARPGEWWLAERLLDAGCGWIHLLGAIWIAPLDRVDAWQGGTGGEGVECEEDLFSILRDREAQAFADALRVLAARRDPAREWLALELCERAGLPCAARSPAAATVAAAFRGGVDDGRIPDSIPSEDSGELARRLWARAWASSSRGPGPDPIVATFCALKSDPQQAQRAARAWLKGASQPSSGPTMESARGVAAILRLEPSLSIPETRVEQLPWHLCAAVRGGSEREPWTAGELAVALQGPDARRVAESLDDPHSLDALLGCVERLCEGLSTNSASPSGLEVTRAGFRSALAWIRWSLAAQGDESSVRVGRLRAVLQRARRGVGEELGAIFSEQADRFWLLGSSTRPADWLLDLDEWGWLPARK